MAVSLGGRCWLRGRGVIERGGGIVSIWIFGYTHRGIVVLSLQAMVELEAVDVLVGLAAASSKTTSCHPNEAAVRRLQMLWNVNARLT
jgi:hypothetical protein